jgi:hypothetical protein
MVDYNAIICKVNKTDETLQSRMLVSTNKARGAGRRIEVRPYSLLASFLASLATMSDSSSSACSPG